MFAVYVDRDIILYADENTLQTVIGNPPVNIIAHKNIIVRHLAQCNVYTAVLSVLRLWDRKYIRPMLDDTLACCLRYVTSEERRAMMVVSTQWARVCLSVSRSLSLYPHWYDVCLNGAIFMGACERTQLLHLAKDDIHLYHRMKPRTSESTDAFLIRLGRTDILKTYATDHRQNILCESTADISHMLTVPISDKTIATLIASVTCEMLTDTTIENAACSLLPEFCTVVFETMRSLDQAPSFDEDQYITCVALREILRVWPEFDLQKWTDDCELQAAKTLGEAILMGFTDIADKLLECLPAYISRFVVSLYADGPLAFEATTPRKQTNEFGVALCIIQYAYPRSTQIRAIFDHILDAIDKLVQLTGYTADTIGLISRMNDVLSFAVMSNDTDTADIYLMRPVRLHLAQVENLPADSDLLIRLLGPQREHPECPQLDLTSDKKMWLVTTNIGYPYLALRAGKQYECGMLIHLVGLGFISDVCALHLTCLFLQQNASHLQRTPNVNIDNPPYDYIHHLHGSQSTSVCPECGKTAEEHLPYEEN